MTGERVDVIDPNSLLEQIASTEDKKKLVDFFRSNTRGELKTYTREDIGDRKMQVVAGQALFDGYTQTDLWLSLKQQSDNPIATTISFADSENALNGHFGRCVDAVLCESSNGKTDLLLAPTPSNYVFLNTKYGKWVMSRLINLSAQYPRLS